MVRYPKAISIFFILIFTVMIRVNAQEEIQKLDITEMKPSQLPAASGGVDAEAINPQTCQEFYDSLGECPELRCFLGCVGGIMYPGCEAGCQPKPCLQISAEECPLYRCQLLVSCENKGDPEEEIKVCFDLLANEPAECGGLAYAGQLECCEGMEKRCGVEFFDGSCDMVGANSVYAVPICLPCGNGTCNQFENRCNCPEDCN